MPRFRSLRVKLLVFILAVSLLPLAGISFFAYFRARETITEDRIKLFLEQMAQDTVDKIDLTLLEKQEGVRSMAATLPLHLITQRNPQELERVLNILTQTHEVYDLILVLDIHGNVLAANTLDRFGTDVSEKVRRYVEGHNVSEFPADKRALERSLSGHPSQVDWYSSDLVKAVYDFSKSDIAQQYNIGFSEPLFDRETRNLLGVWYNLMNWGYIQDILDTVEQDLRRLKFESGYAFLFKRDANTIIGHKYRKNRIQPHDPTEVTLTNNYGTRLVETHGLPNLHEAALRGDRTVSYYYPARVEKISGLARMSNNAFGWICGVGINNQDIFKPVQILKYVFISATLGLAALVVMLTYVVTRGITVPLKRLTTTAQRMSEGQLHHRVLVNSNDEVGLLGQAFNEMATSIAVRDEQLLELNKNLELKVKERTEQLEKSNEALQKAYQDLQGAQQHLIQSEKMASLGQLVAGIAHEIKNPLNFIYGNTGFLSKYVGSLKSLIAALEHLPSIDMADHRKIQTLKGEMDYDFLIQDLDTLVANFAEGAQRINNIVKDLRTFSRMDAEQLSDIDLHASIDVALNLLANQYRGRIQIHREYAHIPHIQGYEGKLNQVFMNLLSNAIQAVEKEGDIWIRTSTGNGQVKIQIQDNGIGIPRNHLHKIFEPFFTTKGVGQGTGLGLSISYGIVQQHEGRIVAESTPGQGSTFTVILPAKPGKGSKES